MTDDPLFDIATEFTRQHMRELSEASTSTIKFRARLAELLRQTQNDAITACASAAMSMTCHSDEERSLRGDTVIHIMAMRRSLPSEGMEQEKA